MPASFIAELILQLILEFFFYFLAYPLGRVVVPLISLGRWSCDPLLRETPKKRKRWGGMYHLRGDRVYFTSEGTSLVGIIVVLIVIALLVGWRFLLRTQSVT